MSKKKIKRKFSSLKPGMLIEISPNSIWVKNDTSENWVSIPRKTIVLVVSTGKSMVKILYNDIVYINNSSPFDKNGIPPWCVVHNNKQ